MKTIITLMEQKENKEVYKIEYMERCVYVFVTFSEGGGEWDWHITRSRDVSKELQLQSWQDPEKHLMLYAEAVNFARKHMRDNNRIVRYSKESKFGGNYL